MSDAKAIEPRQPGRIIGWDRAKAGDVTCYAEGEMSDAGVLTITKILYGHEAEKAISEHLNNTADAG